MLRDIRATSRGASGIRLSGDPLPGILIAILLFYYIPAIYSFGWLIAPDLPIDFPSYYYASWFTFVAGKSPYGAETFRFFSEAYGQWVNPYVYPPPSLLAFWPLSYLSLTGARVVFLVVSHCCFVASIWLMLSKLMPHCPDRRLRDIALIVSLGYLLSFDPAYASLGIGQINLIALLFICLTLVAARGGSSPWRIALPLSFAILLKTYPVLLLLPLLLRRQFRAVALTCVFFGTFAVASFYILPSGTWSSWFTTVLPQGGYANDLVDAGYIWNQSVNGFLTRLLRGTNLSPALLPFPWLAKPVTSICALLALGTTAYFSYALSKQGNHSQYRDDEMSAYLLMIFIIAPLSWDHHLVYILPAVVLLISRLVYGSVTGILAAALAASAFLIAWRLPLDHAALRNGLWTLLISAKLFPVVGLWLYFIARLYRSRSMTGNEVVPVNDAVFHDEFDLA